MILQLDDFKSFIDWLQIHPSFAALAVFLISCAESLAIIGLFIPGTIIMPAIGGMIGAGILPAYWILLAAILGAVAGDGFSYWLGHHYHEEIRNFWLFKRVPKMLDHGARFFNKYGGLSVFIGRFVGPVRPIIPVVAGMLNMSSLRFLVANIFSAIAWALVYMAPGMLLGAISEELAPHVAAHLLLMCAVVALCIACVSWLINKLCDYCDKRFTLFCKILWRMAGTLSPQLTHALSHQHRENYKPIAIILYIVMTLLFLFGLSAAVLHNKTIPYIDWPTFLFLRSINIPPLTTVMAYGYNLTSTVVLLSVGGAITAWLIMQKSWRVGFYWCLNVVLAVLLMAALKFFVPMTAPDLHSQVYYTHTFPNIPLGIFSALLGNFLLVSYYRKIWRYYKKIFLLCLCILLSCATLPTIYFGFYWLSSCIGAVMCAIASTWLSILFFYRKKTALDLRVVSFIAAVAMLIATIATSLHANKWFILQFEKPQFTVHYNAAQWWHNAPLPVATYRKNILGKIAEPMSVEYAGNLNALVAVLKQQGWQVAPKPSLAVILNRIGAKNRADQLPLFPDLYFFEKPIIVLTKPSDASHKMLILRLWSSGVLLMPDRIPLWIGTIHYYNPWRWRREKNPQWTNFSALQAMQGYVSSYANEITLPARETCTIFCTEMRLKIFRAQHKKEVSDE
jgi:membrane protein DedA with SNARE-associated domain